MLRNLSLIRLCLSMALPLAVFADKPNVLLILTDDQGYGDLSLHGNPHLKTPAMDSIGKGGVRLDRFYVSPVCAPTRASLLTGKYHLRTGVFGVSNRQEVMNPEETTIAELFQENGYKTGCFGKWHNGAVYPETPNGQGFEEFFGFLGGVTRNYFDPELNRNGEIRRYEGYITELITDAALDWMGEQIEDESPFFCYLPYNAPHTPGLVQEEYWKPYYDKWVGRWESVIYGMVKSIDDQIARVLALLEETGQAESTIVIFMTDNGPNTWRYNAGYRGRKGHLYEGGIRVPCFIRWSGTLEPGLVDVPLAHIDILPTLVELCGLKGTEMDDVDGRSFASLLGDTQAEWEDRLLISFSHGSAAKIRSNGVVHSNRWTAVKSNASWELYDIGKDLRQFRNVADQFPEIVSELGERFESALATMPPLAVRAPVPIGHEGSSKVILKAHDAAMPRGKGNGIDFNYRAGFTGHWISKWTDTEAYAEWDLDILDGGRYRATLSYCLPEENLGVEGLLEIGGQKLNLNVTEVFDPESYQQPYMLDGEASKYESKPWKRLPLGEIDLEIGETVARIRLTKIPGVEGLEIKEIELNRIR